MKKRTEFLIALSAWGETDTCQSRCEVWLIDDFLEDYGVHVTAHKSGGEYSGKRWSLSEFRTGAGFYSGGPGQSLDATIKAARQRLETRGITKKDFAAKCADKRIINTTEPMRKRQRSANEAAK